MFSKKVYTPLIILVIAILLSSCSSIKTVDWFSYYYPSLRNIQNGNTSTDVVLITQDSSSKIYNLKNGRLELISNANLPPYSKSYISKENHIICIDTSSRKIILQQYNSNWQLVQSRDIVYPKTISPVCVLEYKNLIFLGGEHYKVTETFMYYDLDKNEWKLIDIPNEVTRWAGRSIDDLLIVNDTLYAVDDILLPKYILKYSLSDKNYIKFISFHEIPFCIGANGWIQKAVLNNDYMVYLASSRDGYSIGVLKLNDFSHGFELRNNSDKYTTEYVWIDIAVIQNSLYIASYDRLFKFGIRENYFNKNETESIKNYNKNNEYFDNKSLVEVAKIQDGKIVGMKSLLDNNAVVLIIKTDENKFIEKVVNL